MTKEQPGTTFDVKYNIFFMQWFVGIITLLSKLLLIYSWLTYSSPRRTEYILNEVPTMICA